MSSTVLPKEISEPAAPSLLDSIKRTGSLALSEVLSFPGYANALGSHALQVADWITPGTDFTAAVERIDQEAKVYYDLAAKASGMHVLDEHPLGVALGSEIISAFTPIPLVRNVGKGVAGVRRGIGEFLELVTPMTAGVDDVATFTMRASANAALGVASRDLGREMADESTMYSELLAPAHAEMEADATRTPLEQYVAQAERQRMNDTAAKENEGTPYDWKVALAGGAASAFAARAFLRSRASAKHRSQIIAGKPSKPEQRINLRDSLESKLLDPASMVARKATKSDDAAADLVMQIDQNTMLGGGARGRDFTRTGQFPGSKLETTAPLQWGMQYFKSADELQRVVKRTMEARDLRNRTSKKITHKEALRLEADIDAGMLQPKVRRMIREYDKITRSMLDFAVETDFISKKYRSQMVEKNPGYLPRYKLDERSKLAKLNDFLKSVDAQDYEGATMLEFDRFMKSTDIPRRILDPASALVQTSQGLVQAALRAKVQRDVFKGLEAEGWASKAKKTDNKGDIVKVRSGQADGFVSYRVDDPALRLAAQMAPSTTGAITGAMNAVSKGFKAGTTGIAAPWFAGKSLLYDALFGSFITGARQGRKFGVSGGGLADPTGITPTLQSLRGVGMDSGAKLLREVSETIRATQASSNAMTNWLANTSAGKGLADWSAARYLTSTHRLMERHGAVNVGFIDDPITAYKSTVGDVLSKAKADVPEAVLRQTARAYSGILHSVHQGARVGYFAQNLKRVRAAAKKEGRHVTDKEMQSLAYDTRNLAGDFSKMGTGQVYNTVAKSVPYSNVFVQATRRAVLAFKHDPVRATAAMTTSMLGPLAGAAYFAQNATPEQKDYWYNRVPAWERARSIPFAHLGGGERDITFIPMAPEMVPMWGIVSAILEGSGIPINDPKFATSTYDDMSRTLLDQVLPFSIPPAVKFASNIANSAAILSGNEPMGMPFQTSKPPRTHVPEDYVVREGHVALHIRDVLKAAFGTAADTMITLTETMLQGGDVPATAKQEVSTRIPGGSATLWSTPKEYRGGATNQAYWHKDKGVQELRNAWKTMAQGNIGQSSPPVDTSQGPLQRHIAGATLEEQVANRRLVSAAESRFFADDSRFAALEFERSRLRVNRDEIKARRDINPRLRQGMLNGYNKREAEIQRVMLNSMNDFEKQYGVDLANLPQVLK